MTIKNKKTTSHFQQSIIDDDGQRLAVFFMNNVLVVSFFYFFIFDVTVLALVYFGWLCEQMMCICAVYLWMINNSKNL